jgi:hypothetical protein
MCLLRLLGRNFVNWAEVDGHRAWHNGATDGRAQETNDYRIIGQSAKTLDIGFHRVLHVPGADGYVSTTKGRLSYNAASSAPTSVTQETITQPPSGAANEVIEDLTLTLQSDSLVAARPG